MTIIIEIPAQEIAALKQLTCLENDADAIITAAREFLRLCQPHQARVPLVKMDSEPNPDSHIKLKITAADIRKRILERPFQPFRVYLTDGRSFDIRNPAWNLVGEAELHIGVAPEGDPHSRLPERSEWIDYRLIARVEPLTAASGVT